MMARITRFTVPTHRIDEATRIFDSAFLNAEGGFIDGWVLADEQTGDLVTLTLWLDSSSLQRSERAANDLGSKAMKASGGQVEDVETYRVISQATALPQP